MDSLSGGERQKVYIAMLIAQDTDVILLDEPTTYLDIHYQFELMDIICNLKQQGKTIITVLHDLSLALKYADRVVIINQGKIEGCGSPNDICQSGMIDEVFHVHMRQLSPPGGEYVFSPVPE